MSQFILITNSVVEALASDTTHSRHWCLHIATWRSDADHPNLSLASSFSSEDDLDCIELKCQKHIIVLFLSFMLTIVTHPLLT